MKGTRKPRSAASRTLVEAVKVAKAHGRVLRAQSEEQLGQALFDLDTALLDLLVPALEHEMELDRVNSDRRRKRVARWLEQQREYLPKPPDGESSAP